MQDSAVGAHFLPLLLFLVIYWLSLSRTFLYFQAFFPHNVKIIVLQTLDSQWKVGWHNHIHIPINILWTSTLSVVATHKQQHCRLDIIHRWPRWPLRPESACILSIWPTAAAAQVLAGQNELIFCTLSPPHLKKHHYNEFFF